MREVRHISEKWFRITRISALTIAVLATGLSMAMLAWQNAIDVVATEDQERFQRETSDSLELIEERMETYEQVLRGVKGLFVASENVNRNEFKAYSEELDLSQTYPGILGIAFSLYIAADDREQHIANIRAEGFPQYTLSPEGDREQSDETRWTELN